VTAGQPARGPGAYPGLRARLIAAVRVEFRADVLVFDPRDPVFGGPPCQAAGCERPARERGLCLAHQRRWLDAGQPDLAGFAATTGAHWYGHRPLASCEVPGCRYGRDSRGLCGRHVKRWRKAGQPDLVPWREDQALAPPSQQPPACLAGSCGLWASGASLFCRGHHDRWRDQGRPDPAEFAAACADPGPGSCERIDLRCLGPQLRLEVQYVLQCRRDEAQAKIVPIRFQPIVRGLAAVGVSSLLAESDQHWRRCPIPPRTGTGWRAFVLDAYRRIENLAVGSGWDIEYPRDVWRLANLGIAPRQYAHLSFTAIPQPWLKDLAKRWARWQLATGLSAGWVALGAGALSRLAGFLAAPQVNITRLADLDRALIERYLADLHAEFGGRRTHAHHLGALAGFLRAIRQHGWDSTLPATAVVLPEDYPARGKLLPRALPPAVLAQIQQPASLDRWGNPAHQLITLILMRCGLRIGDAVRLPFHCVVTDAGGAPYLRYYNHKMRREALVPLDSELREQIAGQQAAVLERWPDGTPVLFPAPQANLDGHRPVRDSGYRAALNRWLQRCDIRDEHGRPVTVTPHQFRHSLGTTLINRDVPQHVVQKILDHDSPVMTAHYARLSDTTVREHWEKARKVDAAGQPVHLSPDGPLGDAAWAKHHLSRATQALPNGYCQLPLVQTCPHANSCLTCPMFATTAEFLPQHRAQRQATLQIITSAEAKGHARVAEMNKQVAANLDKIITALEDDPDSHQAAADAS
jgi:integrase